MATVKMVFKIICAVSMFCSFILILNIEKLSIMMNSTNSENMELTLLDRNKTLNEQQPYMADWKCPNIYIDLGSNIGVQIRKIFEPEKYPKTSISYVLNKTMKHFAKFLGDIETRRKHCCVFGFEANPK
eukprot:773726_1